MWRYNLRNGIQIESTIVVSIEEALHNLTNFFLNKVVVLEAIGKQ
jgi:hypothetical protein